MSNNKKIIDLFEKLLDQYEFEYANVPGKKDATLYRIQNTQKIINALKKYPKKITSSNQLEEIKGIGSHTLKRIDEILNTGSLSELYLKGNEKQLVKEINELENVIGIGKKKAYELVKEGIHSVKQLKEYIKKNKIDVNDNIKKGLYYHNKMKEHIPRKEVSLYEKIIRDILKKINKDLISQICGSYRRKKKFSNDIDVLIVNKRIKTEEQAKKSGYLELIVNKLKKLNIIVDNLTGYNVKTKFMGFAQLPKKPIRRIDIRFLGYESYFPALLYFTGSGVFNQKMRLVAESKGYLLNEYGLYKLKGNKKIKIPVSSERDIFNILGLQYLEPEEREI